MLFLASAFLFIAAPDASAYLDPGTGNMILQAVVGAVAGGLVVMKIYWNRLKEFLFPSRRNAKGDEPPAPPASGS